VEIICFRPHTCSFCVSVLFLSNCKLDCVPPNNLWLNWSEHFYRQTASPLPGQQCQLKALKGVISLFVCLINVYVCAFTTKIGRDTRQIRTAASVRLRTALQKNPNIVRTRRCFVVRLPDVSEHSNHPVGPVRFVV